MEQTMMSDDTTTTTASSIIAMAAIPLLERACQLIFDTNFDTDTKQCFLTIIKLYDNILVNPTMMKYRTINLQNKVLQSKIRQCRNAVEFLVACGFIDPNNNTKSNNTITTMSDNNPPLLLASSSPFQQSQSTSISQPTTLVLPPWDPNTTSSSSSSSSTLSSDFNYQEQYHYNYRQLQILQQAREILVTKLRTVLGCQPNEIPVLKSIPLSSSIPPPSSSSAGGGTTARAGGNGGTTAPATFNPYVGYYYDGLAASTGISTRPSDTNYISPTELQLQSLQQKQQKVYNELLQKKQQQQTQRTNRQWKAYRPNQQPVVANNNRDDNGTTTTTNGDVVMSDSNLLFQRQKQLLEQQKQRDSGGFTTKAMRDVQKLTKTKLYKSVVLTIQFPDGTKLISSNNEFVPIDTVGTVKESIQNDCLLNNNNNSPYDFDLYITPPRRLLNVTKTLQEEDLVPAAKLFVSWKQQPAPTQSFIQEHIYVPLIASSVASTITTEVLFPKGQSLVEDNTNDNTKPAAKEEATNKPDGGGKPKPAKKSREDDLLRRMMGRK